METDRHTDRQTDRQTHRTTTVTLAAHARRGLKSIDSYTQSLILYQSLILAHYFASPLSSLLLLLLLKYLDGKILVQTNFERCQSSGIVSG